MVNWSSETLRAHELKRKNKARSQIPHTESEQDKAPALGTAIPREAESIRRTHVLFVGYRVRPLDPDNFAGSVKDLLDGLKHACLLEDDSPEYITLETRQVKVKSFSEEQTVIEITKE